jgi:hypothetical protein
MGNNAVRRLRSLVVMAVLACLVCTSSGLTADDEPPIVGQPDHFNGAVGRFQVTASADRVKLEAEDPLTYTVRVSAEGKVKQPPERPNLAEFPEFPASFYVEDIGPPAGKQIDARTWEFAYRLKPKSTEVKSIPAFPFVFFRPGYLPARLGYMTIYTKAIPITVTPRQAVAVAAPVSAPDAALVLADGDLLRQAGDPRLPGAGVLLLMALAPPAGCLAWYAVWRRRHPDVAHAARRRRSRAAHEALQMLRRIGEDGDPRELARCSADAVAEYIRQRLGLPVQEPTPAEAEAHLRRLGIAQPLAEETAALLRTCAALQFEPGPQARPGFREATTRLILSLEAATWRE